MIWWKKITFLIVFTLTFSISSYLMIPRIKNDVNYINKVYNSIILNDKNDLVQNSWRNMYQRFLVTKYTINEINNNLFFGIGLENVDKVLGKKIINDGYKYFQKINPHNQYLHVWLGMGLLSFIFFIIMLLNFFSYQPFSFYFILFYLICMLTESVLVRVKGISLFFIFILFLSTCNYETKKT